jgi:hypothetical protein
MAPCSGFVKPFARAAPLRPSTLAAKRCLLSSDSQPGHDALDGRLASRSPARRVMEGVGLVHVIANAIELTAAVARAGRWHSVMLK